MNMIVYNIETFTEGGEFDPQLTHQVNMHNYYTIKVTEQGNHIEHNLLIHLTN